MVSDLEASRSKKLNLRKKKKMDESRRFYKQETTEWSQTSKLLEAEN